MQENNRVKIIVIIAILIIIGISFISSNRYWRKHLQILYISQAEILALEKARIKDEKDKQLFFGRPEDAVKYIEKEQDNMIKNGDLVLLTDSKIYGSNVRSISRQVHEEIINKLAELRERK